LPCIRERRPAQVPRHGALPPAALSRRNNHARQRLAVRARVRGMLWTHVEPLACGGIDAPENMQWQAIAEAKAKDKWERNACQRPASIPAVALPLETSVPPRDSWREERRDQRAENRGPRLTSSVTTTGLRSPRVRMARPHSAREIKNRGPRKAPQQTQTW